MKRLRIALLLLICCMCSASAKSGFTCKEAERHILLKLKHSFFDTLNTLGSWVGEDCCSWNGVGCGNVTGHVIKLDLSDGYLQAGEVNPALLELKYLTYLDLSGIDFNGSAIPDFLGSMRYLRYLKLSNAIFAGEVPHSLGNLAKLVVLDLGGIVSTETNTLKWAFKLKNLQHLDLSRVNLSQALDSLHIVNNLSSLSVLNLEGCSLGNSHLVFRNSTRVVVSSSPLQHLDLHDNLFSGPIPNFIQNFSSITFLDLSYNSFNSPIPSWLGNKIDLTYLKLDSNSFNGSFPHFINNLTFLSYLDLSSNQFSSTIPSWLPSKRYLEFLDLSQNHFEHVEGGIINIIGHLCSLTYLDLSDNQLQEEVLESNVSFYGCSRCDLEHMDMHSNNMSGQLPTFRSLKSLQYLGLSNNNFETVPSSFGELSSLKSIDLSHNAFEVIPASFGKMPSLVSINLSYNHLSVVHQESFVNLSSLKSLDLSSNSITFELSRDWLPPFQLESLYLLPCKFNSLFPKWISSQEYILKLDLSDTGIFGPLPDNIGSAMPSLKSLKLAENHINGSIPRSLCELESLEVLDLKRNKLTGTIPDCLVNSVLGVELSSNELSGPIPGCLPGEDSYLSKTGALQLLSLNNNSLEGELPFSLSNCKMLRVLDVGRNNLHGQIPTWNGIDVPALGILILRENKFMGLIPPQLCSIDTIQIIDLASNVLVGAIPQCFGHFPFMASIALPPIDSLAYDVVYSKKAVGKILRIDPDEWSAVEVLKGQEREYKSVLHLLVNMDLSCNNLIGAIPVEITNLSLLHGLNLSHNHFMGAIPKEIGKMKSLESLDLSFNNLSGEIPESLSSIDYLSKLNFSFNNLQGQIPTGSQLQALLDPSIYMGNPGLCGDPLPRKCFSDNNARPPSSTVTEDEDEDNKHEKIWFYLVIMLGFATGFWGVVGTLVFVRSARHAFFQLAEDLADWLYVRVAVRIAQIRGRK